jgi:hypothetical protein
MLTLAPVGCAAPAKDGVWADERWLRGQFAEDGWLVK